MDWQLRLGEFHDLAIGRTGYRAFGADTYHQGLHTLLEALDQDPPASQGGIAAAEGLIVGSLASRLITEARWSALPAYRNRDIAAPLIVMGMPRTGTTALHNLLSRDPQFQGIEKWLTAGPKARPPRDAWEDDPQFAAARAAVERMFAIAPDVMKAHGVLADEVDECLLPMAQEFTSNWFPSQLDIPRYDAWLRSADETTSYRRYKDILRLVGLSDDRRWLLKNPSHVFGVEAMLAVFPDACIVQTHRHPVASLSSLVNLLGNIMLAASGRDIDRKQRLDREADFWAEAVRRSMTIQDKYPERFVNVLQQDIRRDPLAVVETIYARFGIALSGEAEAAMRHWAAANEDRPDGGHRYEQIADAPTVVEAFDAYIGRYGLEKGSRR